ncbi:MAG: transcriptional regulator [Ruminococcus sp.]|nr:transcriptional regulator [Ruminococcus sp.]
MQFPRMKELREEAGLKQKDLAQAMKVTKGSYSMWECGSDTIPLRRLNEFCNYFDVSIDYVVGLNDKRKYANATPDIKLKITGDNLKKIRNKKNLTQTAIANELSINQPTWNRYENSRTLILTVVLIELAQKYHYSIDKILGKDKEEDKNI